MNVRTPLLIAAVLICLSNVFAQNTWYQSEWNWSDARIDLEIDKIKTPTKILYVAAHPDDENTRMISWLVNHVHADVAYLSMTRGSGGQNLIGTELGVELGLIREQELLAARRIDGGKQFFTTALDFGYSKSHEETLKFWDKDKILSEVVYYIREFKPDVIITRFSPSTDGIRRTHGHHTASAILAKEAFTLAADPEAYPEQLNDLNVWKTKAIYWNTGWWSYGSQENLDSVIKAEPERFVALDVEAYVPGLGMTCQEIAAQSRSMHKSQGFGTMAYYGPRMEYLELLAGDHKASDIFSPYYAMLSSYLLAPLEKARNSKEKSKLLKEAIGQARADGKYSQEQIRQLEMLWLRSLGLRVLAEADASTITTGKQTLNLSVVHYAEQNLNLVNLVIEDTTYELNKPLLKTEMVELKLEHKFRHALREPMVHLTIDGIQFQVPLIFRGSDPVKGERIEKVLVTHPLLLELDESEMIIVNQTEASITGRIRALINIDKPILLQAEGSDGLVELVGEYRSLSEGQVINFNYKTRASNVSFNLTYAGGTVQETISTIEHDHLPKINKISKAEVRLHFVKSLNYAKKVGYVMGAGDKVPECTRLLGAEVDLIDHASISAEELAKYDVIVFGIRALNTIEDIGEHLPKFHAFVKNGHTLILQYNTSHRLKTDQIMPEGYNIKLSRNRVTQENAAVSVDAYEDLIGQPNVTGPEMWNHWVQERGLYFPESWSDQFRAPLRMNDTGEDPLAGSLLIAEYGKGHIVYTGISFFRQLPAGVEGAYQLWANLLSLSLVD